MARDATVAAPAMPVAIASIALPVCGTSPTGAAPGRSGDTPCGSVASASAEPGIGPSDGPAVGGGATARSPVTAVRSCCVGSRGESESEPQSAAGTGPSSAVSVQSLSECSAPSAAVSHTECVLFWSVSAIGRTVTVSPVVIVTGAAAPATTAEHGMSDVVVNSKPTVLTTQGRVASGSLWGAAGPGITPATAVTVTGMAAVPFAGGGQTRGWNSLHSSGGGFVTGCAPNLIVNEMTYQWMVALPPVGGPDRSTFAPSSTVSVLCTKSSDSLYDTPTLTPTLTEKWNGRHPMSMSAWAVSHALRLPEWKFTSSAPPAMTAAGVRAKYTPPETVTFESIGHEKPTGAGTGYHEGGV